MSRKHEIINELEAEFNETVDEGVTDDILCDGDTCRHEECACWDTLSWAVREHLINKQYPTASEIVRRAAAKKARPTGVKALATGPAKVVRAYTLGGCQGQQALDAAAVNITKDEIKDLICRRGLSLTDVIDVVCELNGFVGVGLISFGDQIAGYIKGKIEKRSTESWLNE